MAGGAHGFCLPPSGDSTFRLTAGSSLWDTLSSCSHSPLPAVAEPKGMRGHRTRAVGACEVQNLTPVIADYKEGTA
jgi:hypothetical protein